MLVLDPHISQRNPENPFGVHRNQGGLFGFPPHKVIHPQAKIVKP
jgi:hypothetical protein